MTSSPNGYARSAIRCGYCQQMRISGESHGCPPGPDLVAYAAEVAATNLRGANIRRKREIVAIAFREIADAWLRAGVPAPVLVELLEGAAERVRLGHEAKKLAERRR